MDIYSLITKDHDDLRVLLGRLVESSPARPEWRTLIDLIADELVPHLRAEEAVFYNPIRDLSDGEGQVRHAYAEHALAEADLRALQGMRVVDPKWHSTAKKLHDDVLHHAEDEEQKVFKEARGVLSEGEAEQIGEAFEKLKPLLSEQSGAGVSFDPSLGPSLDSIAELMPARLRQGLKSHFGRGMEKAS